MNKALSLNRALFFNDLFDTIAIQVKSVGENISEAIAAGLAASAHLISEAATNAVNAAIAAAKQAAGIASPSKKGLAIGDNIGGSMATGVGRQQSKLATSGAQIVSNALGVMQRAARNMGGINVSGLRLAPTNYAAGLAGVAANYQTSVSRGYASQASQLRTAGTGSISNDNRVFTAAKVEVHSDRGSYGSAQDQEWSKLINGG